MTTNPSKCTVNKAFPFLSRACAPKCTRRLLQLEHLEHRVVMAATVFDFSVNDGGFSSVGRFGAFPFEYAAGQWTINGTSERFSFAFLTSPEITVEESPLPLTMEHSYSFLMDPPNSFLDGGRLEVRINGGGWNTVVPDDGYDASAVTGLASPGWAGDSGGTVTDTVEIGAGVGDSIDTN